MNRRNQGTYLACLTGLAGIRLMPLDERGACDAQHVVALVDGTSAPRDLLLAVLTSENVLARRYFYPGCATTRSRISADREPHERRCRSPSESWRKSWSFPAG